MSKFMIMMDLSEHFKIYITEDNTWTSNRKSCYIFHTERKAQNYLNKLGELPNYIKENFDIDICNPIIKEYRND